MQKIVLTKNRFIELLNAKVIVKKGGKYYNAKGIEVVSDEPIETPKPKKTSTKKVEENVTEETN